MSRFCHVKHDEWPSPGKQNPIEVSLRTFRSKAICPAWAIATGQGLSHHPLSSVQLTGIVHRRYLAVVFLHVLTQGRSEHTEQF